MKTVAFQKTFVRIAWERGEETAWRYRVYEELIGSPVIAQRAALVLVRRCPYDVGNGSEKQVRAAVLNFSSVWLGARKLVVTCANERDLEREICLT
jgi:hypothetical protein